MYIFSQKTLFDRQNEAFESSISSWYTYSISKFIGISQIMKKYILLALQALLICNFIQTDTQKTTPKKVCVIIPAYNEEKRIESTLEAYLAYFDKFKDELDTTFLVVANNCKDRTVPVCKKIQKNHKNLEIMDLEPGGKGFALKEGFLEATKKSYDYIGFVDADMATLPQHYHDLIKALPGTDGIIASRYADGANVWPKRPLLKKIGGKFYNWVLRKQFNVPFKDTQCGAKIFTYDTIKKVAPKMTEKGWAFDLEFLYLCQLENKQVKEIPTTWSDQPGSHLEISTKLIKEFLASPGRIKDQHKDLAKEKKQAKKKIKQRNQRSSKKSLAVQ